MGVNKFVNTAKREKRGVVELGGAQRAKNSIKCLTPVYAREMQMLHPGSGILCGGVMELLRPFSPCFPGPTGWR